jgi:phospholipase C
MGRRYAVMCMNRLCVWVLFFICVAIVGCSGSGGAGGMSGIPNGRQTTPVPSAPPGQTIKHVVILIQENRSFDNLFATYPGADGTTYGILHDGKKFYLTKGPLPYKEIDHLRCAYLTEYDGGKMDGFDQINYSSGCTGPPAGTYPLRYVNPSQIQPYWSMAKNYALADHMFQTQGSGSFTAHQELIAGGTVISPTKSLIDLPSYGPWGCDAPTPGPGHPGGTVTSYITTSGQFFFNLGPFPCLNYKALPYLLDPKGISWKYYVPALIGNTGFLWNAFDAIRKVRYGRDWKIHDVSPETLVFGDVAANELPAVSWIVPCGPNSDHSSPVDTGPSWVAGVVNAIGKSPAWKSTVIIVVWDDWGGFFDHVPPAFIDNQGGLGFRVPMLAISPYSKTVGYISHTQYEFGSILKFIENNWNLGNLGATDVRAASIADMFDFSKPPRPFVPIRSAPWKSCDKSQDFPPDDE